MAKKRKVTVSIKVNRDGSMTYKSTGGFDLRNLFPKDFGTEAVATHEGTGTAEVAEKAGGK